jgi:hypothetical protein
VRNPGPNTLSGWEVSWTYGGNQTIFNSWNADLDQSGPSVTAGNLPYNGTIPAGLSTTFGVQGTVTGTNAVPTLSCTS